MMNPLCNNCGVHQPLVYCKWDDARLCLHCDALVHSANSISNCHVRTQLCGHCGYQPAVSWFPDGRLALCRLCDLKAGWPFDAGCPTLDELSVLLSGASSIPVNGTDGFCRLPEPLKFEPTLFPSSLSYVDRDSNTRYSWGQDQTTFNANGSNLPTLEYGAGNENQREGLNIGEQGFNIYSKNGMLGCLQSHSRFPFLGFGLDEIFMKKNLSFASSNCHLENAVEETNSTFDKLLSNLDNNRIIFPPGNVCSNTSVLLSNLTDETSWDSNQEIGRSLTRVRSETLMRFMEKRRQRLKGLANSKRVKHASRKASADIKMRAKGRFIKTGGSFGQEPPPESK